MSEEEKTVSVGSRRDQVHVLHTAERGMLNDLCTEAKVEAPKKVCYRPEACLHLVLSRD